MLGCVYLSNTTNGGSLVCIVCMQVISTILSRLVLASLKTRHGSNIISFHFFCLYLDELSVDSASSVCGVTDVTIAALFRSSSLLRIWGSDRAALTKAGHRMLTVAKSPGHTFN